MTCDTKSTTNEPVETDFAVVFINSPTRPVPPQKKQKPDALFVACGAAVVHTTSPGSPATSPLLGRSLGWMCLIITIILYLLSTYFPPPPNTWQCFKPMIIITAPLDELAEVQPGLPLRGMQRSGGAMCSTPMTWQSRATSCLAMRYLHFKDSAHCFVLRIRHESDVLCAQFAEPNHAGHPRTGFDGASGERQHWQDPRN